VGLDTIVESIDENFIKKNFDEDDPYLDEYDFDEHAANTYVFEYLAADPSLYRQK
jgi:hypothetical protein